MLLQCSIGVCITLSFVSGEHDVCSYFHFVLFFFNSPKFALKHNSVSFILFWRAWADILVFCCFCSWTLQWKSDSFRAWTRQQALLGWPVTASCSFLFPLPLFSGSPSVFFSPSACRRCVSGCVDAGQCSLVAACAHSEKEEKVDNEFSVKAARLGAG